MLTRNVFFHVCPEDNVLDVVLSRCILNLILQKRIVIIWKKRFKPIYLFIFLFHLDGFSNNFIHPTKGNQLFMPNKDLCEKDLLRVPAVFASLVNLLLFDNKNVIQPEQIRYLDFSAHFFFNRRLHPLYHDVGAIVLGSKHNLPFLFCFENQTHSDWLMPVRIFCYMATVFLWQIRQIRATRKNKDPDFPLERLIPCVIFTLHYGPYVWKPKSFRQLFRYDAYPYLQPFLSDYKINIENIACWDREKIASIHSDFRFVADYCRQM